jgi:ATP-dependent exoDNAse (exonuclease V) alpha subunit
MKGNISELDKLNNKAILLQAKVKFHAKQIELLTAKINQLLEEKNELCKPGFKIPTKK